MPFDMPRLALEYGLHYDRKLHQGEDYTTPTSPTASNGVSTPMQDEEKVENENIVQVKEESVGSGPKPSSQNWNPLSWFWTTCDPQPTASTTPTNSTSPAPPPTSTDCKESYSDVDNARANALKFTLGPEQFGSPFWWIEGMVASHD